jgi:hypothetical protein
MLRQVKRFADEALSVSAAKIEREEQQQDMITPQ